MRIRLLWLVSFLSLTAGPCPAQNIEWPKAQTEAVQLLQELIRIDTTNPPGNERAAAMHLQKLLDADGIETRVLDIGPGRANLYALLAADVASQPVKKRRIS